jgi:serine protease Do
MIARKTGALAGGLILAASLAPVVAGQGPVDDVEAIQRGARVFGAVARSSQIGVTVRDLDDEDGKQVKAGVVIETVSPGGPADKAGMKSGDAITDFDGERVRGTLQFSRLVQETPAGRNVSVVLSRAGQRVTVSVTPEARTFSDDFNMRLLDVPAIVRPALPPSPPPAPRAARPPAATPMPPMPFNFGGDPFTILAGRGRLGITMEDLNSQLAEFFGVKEGVLVKSVAEGSAAAKAGLKAGDVITGFNGNHVYDTSDVSRALNRMDNGGDFSIEVVRDRKTQTLKGKLEGAETRSRTRVRTTL